MSSAEPSPSLIRDDNSPRLPLELVAHIIEDAVADLVDKKYWGQAAAFCLVSASVVPFAKKALYHTITLYDRHRSDWSDPRGLDFAAHSRSSPNNKVFDALEASPALAGRVRCLNMQFSSSPITTLLLSYDLARALSLGVKVERIDTLEAVQTHWSDLDTVLRKSGRIAQLKSIDVARFGLALERDPDTCVLQQATSLQRLRLGQADFNLEPTFRPSFQLVSFTIDLPWPNVGQAISQFLLPNSTASLRHLSFTYEEPMPDLTPFIALQSLHLEGNVFENQPPADPLKIIETCKSLPSLARLTLSFSKYDESGGSAFVQRCQRDHLLINLPSTLVRLDIRTLPFDPVHLIAFLHPFVSPCLRRLDVWRIELFEQELRQLEQVCWSRGVELYSYE